MDEPTALFNSYEQDFKHLLNEVREKLEGTGKDGAEAKKAALRKVEMSLDEADEMISQMQIEIQGIPKSMKSTYSARLKNAQSELSRYKKLSKDAHTQASRASLFSFSAAGIGGRMSTSDEPYADDRTRLLAGTDVLDDGMRRLQDSERIALETEEEGAGILNTLRRQREQIENSRDTLRTADTSIDRATGTLKKMIRRRVPLLPLCIFSSFTLLIPNLLSRMYQQRVVMGIIIVILIAVILLILWAKLWRR